MDKESLGWDHWRSFLAVMRAGSLSAAARALALTQPTLGRHVDALEAALAAPLFTRSRAGLEPTTLARSLQGHAEAMEAAAAALARTASGEAEGEAGTVRVTASDIVGVEILPPILAPFREAHPSVVIELSIGNRNEDLLRRDADIAVRMVRPSQEALVARRLGTVEIGLFAASRYAARRGLPETAEALFGHDLIGIDRDRSGTEGVSIGGRPVSREMFSVRADSDLVQLAALRAGLGIGVCQRAIAMREPDLVPVLAGDVGFSYEMWLAMHEDLRASRRVRLLFDHLAAALSAHLAGAMASKPGRSRVRPA